MKSNNKIKVPLFGERTFIVLEKSPYNKQLWLDRQFIADIKLSPSAFNQIDEELWLSILSSYVVEGLRCENYVIHRNFNSLDELMRYLQEGGRITNLDESCNCYVRLVNGEFRFDNGSLLEEKCVVNHPTSWSPFYPSLKMIKEEDSKLIKGLLKPETLE